LYVALCQGADLLVAVELLVQLVLELGLVVLILGKEWLALGVALAATEAGG
jgi:hypothetical protein